MPIAPPGSLVLVTGASGFAGGYIVKALLEAGYRVRVTARSEAKVAHVRALFPSHADSIEGVVVVDISEPSAFDQAVVGIDAVVHAASPVITNYEGDPDDIVLPAVKGVTHLLDALARVNPDIKRFVQISSVAAVAFSTPDGPRVFDESYWNDESVRLVRADGAAASGGLKYQASKTLSERALWDFVKDKKPAFDAVAILPSLILGPPTQYNTTDAVTGSPRLIIPYVLPGKTDAELQVPTYNSVDVRDVALASVRALTTPEAAGERFILSATPLFGNDVAVVAAQFPAIKGYTAGNADKAVREKLDAGAVKYDGSKAERVLGFTYVPKDETIRTTLEALQPKIVAAAA
ncbi:hypothetical protein VHUM_03069 [Vanrija humicola]|uniref:NAD-dependent epimerase/dehydratase domain-containing protein n=1 Tax=Vanrija humicola TaxID=5417 RepID=A0A7D8V0I1_VANHU|nr:hypothetical protein VHUM_03069 [Vanrija humicola]